MDYEKLINRLEPRLKAISRKVRMRYLYCDEDDFYQESLLHLWTACASGKIQDKTDSYILQGCYFFLKNYIRKICKGIENSSVRLDEENNDGAPIEEAASTEAFVMKISSVEVFLLVNEVKGRFTDRENDVFYHRLEGFTTREIGERLGVSHARVVKIGKNIRKKCEDIRGELVNV